MIDGPHWLPRNEGSWSPRRVIVLDAEGDTTELPDAEVDRLMLAVASFTIRPGDRDAAERLEQATFDDAGELWRWVSVHAHHGHSTWLVAHGLHYDYTVTGAERHLAALGWERVDWSTRRGARWVRWRRGRRTLLMVDLYNYLHTSIAEIGKTIMLPKRGTGRPRKGSRAYWLRRCQRDVEIARAAFLRLLEWWDAEDLGRWQLTGPSLAFAAFRHRFLVERSIRVHKVAEARALEREALFGGRREIYRKGKLPEGLWVDLDYVAHYLMTAAEISVPVELKEVADDVLPGWDPLAHVPRGFGIIARVEVLIDDPVAPYRHPRLGVVNQTGRFVTTLCQPELELVVAHGRIVRWIEVATYRMAPALDAWAEWLVGRVHGPGQEPDELIRPLLKDWTRSLIGKFGQRRPERQPVIDGVVQLPDIEITEQTITRPLPWAEQPAPDPLRGEDATHAVPAITAWIHSAARATLWRALSLAGVDDVAYCDTDGIMVRAHEGNLAALADLDPGIDPDAPSLHSAIPEAPAQRQRPTAKSRRAVSRGKIPEVPLERPVPGRMQVKGKFGDVEIHRPQDYVLDGREVIKGLPSERTKLADRVWRAVYWPGIPWQLANSKPGTYTRPLVEVHLGSEYDRGWVLDDGRVVPLVSESRDGRFRIQPWHRTLYARSGLSLADPVQAGRIARKDRSPPT